MTPKQAIDYLLSFDWPDDDDRVRYSEERRGYVGDDGYYGLYFREGLDSEDIEQGRLIPPGMVLVRHWNGDDDELLVDERLYLQALAARLASRGRPELLERVRALMAGLPALD